MNRKLYLFDSNNKKWIAGTYYIRNIAFQLTQNHYIAKNYDIRIVTSHDNEKVYTDIAEDIGIISLFKDKNSKVKKALFAYTRMNGVFYPSSLYSPLMNSKAIQWIPDFQHCHYPEFFSEEEIERRNNNVIKLLNSNTPLVLSSNSALTDIKHFFPVDDYNMDNISVVPFVSYIVPLISQLDDEMELAILNKYELANIRYACIMNQFWKHKNHVIVLEAIKQLEKNADIQFIFTGELNDYRNDKYISQIKQLFDNPIIRSKTKLLGFIDRISQIVIMKHAEFIIQPSLFEGWGTVVEDAKVLDKKILLSDIPVHQEQKNEKCSLFNSKDSAELADLISRELQKEHRDNVEQGIADMLVRAKEYSRGFETLLRKIDERK